MATEAPKEYRNLTNVYYFLANMAKPDPFGEMPITRYLSGLDDTHPAKAVFAMAEIAHPKTRGSFFSSALGTLKHFTNPKIAERPVVQIIHLSKWHIKKRLCISFYRMKKRLYTV